MRLILKKANEMLKIVNLPLYSKIRYKRTMGYWPNLNNPTYFSEKITWLNLFFYPEFDLAIELGDKNGLRERYLNSEIDTYLPPIYGVYSDVEEINFTKLPNKFVVKKSSASNMNAIITDKNKLNIGELKKKIHTWMATDYGEMTGERHYSKMKSTIIVEHFMEEIKREYQIFCFDGRPQFASTVEFDMFKNENADFIDHKKVSNKEIIDVQKLLDERNDISKILSVLYPDIKNIPLVRVDIIELADKIYLGELTFTPAGGLLPNYDKELQLKLGNLINLPK